MGDEVDQPELAEKAAVAVTGAEKKPEEPNPIQDRVEAAAKAREYLNDRSRVVDAAIVAISWGWVASEAKLAIPFTEFWKEAIGLAGGLAFLALLLDYIQFLFQYRDASSFRGFWGNGALLMFRTKLCLTSIATAILMVTAVVIGFNAIRAEAQYGEKWRIYKGSVWKENQSEKRETTLYLSFPNPVTGYTKGIEDGIACNGKQEETKLTLECDTTGAKFEGVIADKSYQGVWSAGTTNGHFQYVFYRVWETKK